VRSHDLNRLLDKPDHRVLVGTHRKYIRGNRPGWRLCQERRAATPVSRLPLQQATPVFGDARALAL